MPRIRTIKPAFFTSEAVAEWHPITRLVFMGLLVHAEDNGVGSANERLLASLIFPMDDRDTAIEWTRRALDECSRGGQITLYEAGGRRLFAVANWAEHQRIDRPSATRFPRPTDAQIAESFADANVVTREDAPDLTLVEPSSSTRRTLDEGSSLEGKGKERKGKNPPSFVGGVQGGALATQLPLVAEVAPPPAPRADTAKGTRLAENWKPSPATIEWTRENSIGVDVTAEWSKFVDFWLAKPGAAGRKVNWDATWRNWVRRAAEQRSSRTRSVKDERVASAIQLGAQMAASRGSAWDEPQRKAIQA